MQGKESLTKCLSAFEEVENKMSWQRNAFYTQVENAAPRYGLQLEFSKIDIKQGQTEWLFSVETGAGNAINQFEDYILTAANAFSDLAFAPINAL